MNLFVLNLLLALVWAVLVAELSPASFFFGYVFGYAALWLAQPVLGGPNSYFLRVWRILRLAAFFIYELFLSSLRVAWDVATPGTGSVPDIIELPLDVQSDLEIMLFSNLISLTPGTLSLDVTEDRKTLYIHAMFADDPKALVAELKAGLERMVLEVFE